MESNPGDGKACKLKAFVALPEALLMPEKISVTVTDLRRTTNISLFPDGGIKRQHSCLNSTDLPWSCSQWHNVWWNFYEKWDCMIPTPFHFSRIIKYKQIHLWVWIKMTHYKKYEVYKLPITACINQLADIILKTAPACRHYEKLKPQSNLSLVNYKRNHHK